MKVLKCLCLMFAFVLCVTCVPSSTIYTQAAEFVTQTKTHAYLLMDAKSGKIVVNHEGDTAFSLASMTKIFSLKLVFDAINNGALQVDDKVRVSEHATSVKGSSAFLDKNKEYFVKDLIKACVVASANDAMVALAEKIAGSEEVFVAKMNDLAVRLQLKNTHFANCTGLPVENHYSSAVDVAIMYQQIMHEPLYKEYAKIWMDTLVHESGRKTDLVNTNRLIKTYTNCDSGKTGYTDDAGFCLVSTAHLNNMQFICVVMGAETSKDRFNLATNLFNFGFANYESVVVLDNENTKVQVPVKNGVNHSVTAMPVESVWDTVEKGEESAMKVKVELFENVSAPIMQGAKVGVAYVANADGVVVKEIDIVSCDYNEKIDVKHILEKLIYEW